MIPQTMYFPCAVEDAAVGDLYSTCFNPFRFLFLKAFAIFYDSNNIYYIEKGHISIFIFTRVHVRADFLREGR